MALHIGFIDHVSWKAGAVPTCILSKESVIFQLLSVLWSKECFCYRSFTDTDHRATEMSTLVGYNEKGFIEMPATGWLHEDRDLIDGNSITYSISVRFETFGLFLPRSIQLCLIGLSPCSMWGWYPCSSPSTDGSRTSAPSWLGEWRQWIGCQRTVEH